LFAAAGSAVISLPLSRIVSVSLRRIFAISLFSILLHDLLDLAQSTDRVPWWPISDKAVGFDLGLLPTDILYEAILFISIFVIFLAYHHFSLRSHTRKEVGSPGTSRRSTQSWVARLTIAVIILAAGSTHYLRDLRERQLYEAHSLLKQRDYSGILVKATQADHWPSTAKPGRTDYLRALAYEGLEDPQRAEHYYLLSYRADPNYFWCVIDLARFTPRKPAGGAAWLLHWLPGCERFADRKELPVHLAGIERKLGGFSLKTK
jgi:hypothetical protein